MWLDDLVRDLRHGVRMLRRPPAFSCVAVLTLGLGIGATTDYLQHRKHNSPAAASVCRFRPSRPRRRKRRLSGTGRAPLPNGVGRQALDEWRALEDADEHRRDHLHRHHGPYQHRCCAPNGGMTSENVFALLGTGAFLGRALGHDDAEKQDVTVLSFDTWQRFFHSDSNVVGTTLKVRLPARPDGRFLTIVG